VRRVASWISSAPRTATEDIFREDPRVVMVSTFQHPFYPHSGVEGRSERMVNVPLRPIAAAEFRALSNVTGCRAGGVRAGDAVRVGRIRRAPRRRHGDAQLLKADYAVGDGKIRDIAERHGAGASFQLEAAMNCTRLAAALPHI